MDALDRLRELIIAEAVASIPRSFLEDLEKRAKLAYADTYGEVSGSRTTQKEQRLAKGPIYLLDPRSLGG